MAPHVCHVLWRLLGHDSAVIDQTWPLVDEAALAVTAVDIVVQVNGKRRGRIAVAADAGRDRIGELALADPNVRRFVAGKAEKKTVIVPGRLVNIVV